MLLEKLLTGQGRESEGDSCRGRDELAVERGKGASAVQVLRLLETQMARDFLSNVSKCHLKHMKGRGIPIPIKS